MVVGKGLVADCLLLGLVGVDAAPLKVIYGNGCAFLFFFSLSFFYLFIYWRRKNKSQRLFLSSPHLKIESFLALDQYFVVRVIL